MRQLPRLARPENDGGELPSLAGNYKGTTFHADK